ncbi:hypothetical protein LOD99_7371 [Oopsacas minuta]|uniref:Uncharacterized protein n=1 Tax=Oopsacas minuta TaxID=111878 RepID=A0AAV7JU81_9METZ|nr:hypothetical protein LOD99_7371 [Oopsacas minuta]
MLFSHLRKYILALIQLIKFIFECVLLLILLYYGLSFYFWLSTPTPYEKTNLVRRFVGQSDSSESTDLAHYEGPITKRPNLELTRIQENRYSAVGYGVEVNEWDSYVEQLRIIYKLTPDVIALLKLAKFQDHSNLAPTNYFNLDRSSGDAEYFRVHLEHKNGKINFAFAGNRVNFQIAPVREVLKHTTTILWAFSWTKERVDIQPRYITMDEKRELEQYFTGRAVENFLSENGRAALDYEKEYNSRGKSDNWDPTLKYIQKLT